jgi:pimeloyl-ACP methyl ester carboxylesterase
MRSLWGIFAVALCWALGLTGCALQSSRISSSIPGTLAESGYKEVLFNPHQRLWYRAQQTGSAPALRLRVYIEGDGASWWQRKIPPADPTPRVSISAALAVLDDFPTVAYLPRPCQWLANVQSCPQAWWTGGRFGEEVIALSMNSLDWLKHQTGAFELELIGHSGGGTLAVLLAARRPDVHCVITLASPLDTEAWARAMSVGALRESHNPLTVAAGLHDVPMWHYFGSQDEIAPEEISKLFLQKWPHAKSVVIEGWTHTKPWVTRAREFKKENCLMDARASDSTSRSPGTDL